MKTSAKRAKATYAQVYNRTGRTTAPRKLSSINERISNLIGPEKIDLNAGEEGFGGKKRGKDRDSSTDSSDSHASGTREVNSTSSSDDGKNMKKRKSSSKKRKRPAKRIESDSEEEEEYSCDNTLEKEDSFNSSIINTSFAWNRNNENEDFESRTDEAQIDDCALSTPVVFENFYRQGAESMDHLMRDNTETQCDTSSTGQVQPTVKAKIVQDGSVRFKMSNKLPIPMDLTIQQKNKSSQKVQMESPLNQAIFNSRPLSKPIETDQKAHGS